MDNPADLGPATEAAIQDLIAEGYGSRDEVLRAGVAELQDRLSDGDGPEELSPEVIAAIERARADIREGRVYTAAQVWEELERRHAASR